MGEAPSLKEDMADVITKLGESGTLTSQIIGRPLPEIRWYRYGKELIQSRKYKMSSDGRNHSLTVATDEQEDEGMYTCRAVNEAGETESSGKLRLQAAPAFHPGFPLKEKYTAGCGTSLRLHVVYIGRPIPQIMWFYAKKPLNASENVIIENTESYTHLVIRNVQRKTNAGKYKVQLTNKFGTVETILKVEIQGNNYFVYYYCNNRIAYFINRTHCLHDQQRTCYLNVDLYNFFQINQPNLRDLLLLMLC